jgi:hypothetical protein
MWKATSEKKYVVICAFTLQLKWIIPKVEPAAHRLLDPIREKPEEVPAWTGHPDTLPCQKLQTKLPRTLASLFSINAECWIIIIIISCPINK